MKHLYLLTLLAALICGNGILRAEPHAVADTLNDYYIDRYPVPHFDGSQLVGKKIVSYQITTATVDNGKRVLKVHEIITEEYHPRQSAGEPVFVLDGKQVTKDEIEGLNPLAIKNMTVIKDGSREDVKKYEGWENGVIFIETKKDGTPVFKTDNSDGPKIIIRRQP